MKKIILAVALLAIFGAKALAASQPNSLGVIAASTATFTGGVALWDRTLAQFATLTPSTTNQMIACSNCTTTKVCISTGIGNAAWVAVSTGTTSLCR